MDPGFWCSFKIQNAAHDWNNAHWLPQRQNKKKTTSNLLSAKTCQMMSHQLSWAEPHHQLTCCDVAKFSGVLALWNSMGQRTTWIQRKRAWKPDLSPLCQGQDLFSTSESMLMTHSLPKEWVLANHAGGLSKITFDFEKTARSQTSQQAHQHHLGFTSKSNWTMKAQLCNDCCTPQNAGLSRIKSKHQQEVEDNRKSWKVAKKHIFSWCHLQNWHLHCSLRKGGRQSTSGMG